MSDLELADDTSLQNTENTNEANLDLGSKAKDRSVVSKEHFRHLKGLAGVSIGKPASKQSHSGSTGNRRSPITQGAPSLDF